jgi:hypothetical protein
LSIWLSLVAAVEEVGEAEAVQADIAILLFWKQVEKIQAVSRL